MQIEGQRQKENDLRSVHAQKQSEEHSRLKRIAKDLRVLTDKQADVVIRLNDAQTAHQLAIKKHAQAELDLQELLDSAAKSEDAKVGQERLSPACFDIGACGFDRVPCQVFCERLRACWWFSLLMSMPNA